MTTTTILFYGIFLVQIALISIYLPLKLRKRILYVFRTYPPAQYPKLYPKPFDFVAEQFSKNGMKTFMVFNYLIAAIGVGGLGMAIASGHTFSQVGGDEVFVILYYFLQMSPIIYAEMKTWNFYKRMREVNEKAVKKADLTPRRLFDYISPAFVGLAVVMIGVFFFVYFTHQAAEGPWGWEVFFTVAAVFASNLLYGTVIAKHLLGKKINPLQAAKDRNAQIEMIIKIMVFASVASSTYLTISILADSYALELYDPVLSSLYFQIFTFFGLGLEFRVLRVNAIDFSVYKKDSRAKPA